MGGGASFMVGHAHTAIKAGRKIAGCARKSHAKAWLFLCEGEEVLCHCGWRWIELWWRRYELMRMSAEHASVIEAAKVRNRSLILLFRDG